MCYYCLFEGHSPTRCPIVIYRINCRKSGTPNTHWYDKLDRNQDTFPDSTEIVPDTFCEICASTEHEHDDCEFHIQMMKGIHFRPEVINRY